MFHLGVTQGPCYSLRIPGTNLLGTWGHPWAPGPLSLSSLSAAFCWLEIQQQSGNRRTRLGMS